MVKADNKNIQQTDLTRRNQQCYHPANQTCRMKTTRTMGRITNRSIFQGPDRCNEQPTGLMRRITNQKE
jgi:hypothetical protein